MNNEMIARTNPVDQISLGFEAYVNNRKLVESKKVDGNGLPNYAYAMDYELRKKLDAIPGLYKVAKSICGTVTTQMTMRANMEGAKVGPTQFPEVYEIVCDCARILGIGIPNVYIMNDPTLNAGTYAYDDVEPIIMVNSGLLERLTLPELRAVIGHECGHIHNSHGIYHTLIATLMNIGMAAASSFIPFHLLGFLTDGCMIALKTWQRAAEVTCDRAGMICADNLEDAYSAEAKMLFGAAFGDHQYDYNAIRAQLDMQVSNISKYEEVTRSHPTAARRIAAEMEYAECETLYQWRPDLLQPDQKLRSRKETDDRCKKVIDLSENG